MHLQWCEKTETVLCDTLGLSIETGFMMPCGDYELMYMVLDDLGVPNDDVLNRDEYNDVYFDFMLEHIDDDYMTDTSINDLIETFMEIKNENSEMLHQ